VKNLSLERKHADDLFVIRALEAEVNLSADLGKQSMVLTDSHVDPRVNLSTALTDDDVAGHYCLSAVTLHAKALRLRIATVSGTSPRFLVCHALPSFVRGFLTLP